MISQWSKELDIQTIIFFIIGLVLLVAGAEVLVRGASKLASMVGISPLVVGLTVVAFGTSTPELAVSLKAAAAGRADVGVGNIVGSNICNILLILGIAASITPLVVVQKLIRFDVPILLGISVLLYLLSLNGLLSRPEAVLLFIIGLGYTAFLIWESRRETRAVKEEYEREFAEPPDGKKQWVINPVLIVLGLVMLTVGSGWLVDGAVKAAVAFGLSELVVGLTVVAIGTSLPEVATSVMASLRGEGDIAVGTVIGSSLFNILVVLGLTGTILPSGIPVSPAAIGFDLPVMLAVTFACFPVFFTGNLIARWEGGLFLAYYTAYVAYLLMNATGHALLPIYSLVMLAFIIPITVITFALLFYRSYRARGRL